MKAVLLLLFVAALASAQFPGGRKFPSPVPFQAPRAPRPQNVPKPIALVSPVQAHHGDIIPIVRQSQDVGFDGTFEYSYETANGISVQERGFLKNPGVKDQEAQAVEGSFSYPGPDGKLLTIRYYADETGFHPEGDHLPVPVKA